MAALLVSALLCLGCLGLGGALARLARLPRDEGGPYLYCLSGAALLLTLALLGAPLTVLVWLLYAGALAALGLAWRAGRPEPGRAGSYALLLGLLAPLALATLYTPLHYWDARSLYFYQGKILFFQNGLTAAFPPPVCWHADYPKLVAVLAALAGQAGGVWNEYLPKAGLMVPLMAMGLGVAGLSLGLGAKAVLLLAFLLLAGNLHHTGYLDGWLAVFCALGHLHFIDYGRGGGRRGLGLALLSLIALAWLKNEGLPLAMISLAAMALACLALRLRPEVKGGLPWAVLLLAALAPVIVWRLYCQQHGLANDLFQEGVGGRVLAALDSGSLGVIWAKAFLAQGTFWLGCASLAFNGGCWLLGRWWRCPFALSPRGYALLAVPWLTALIYGGLLTFIYLATPHDLAWHLHTTTNRVVLPANLLLLLTLLLPIFLGGGAPAREEARP